MAIQRTHVEQQVEPGLMRNRAFVLMFCGMSISLLGNALYQMAVPVWVIQTTGAATDIALLTGSSVLIRLLLTPFAGTVADRTDRRRVMLLATLAQTLIMSALALAFWLGGHHFGVLVAGGALLAVSGAFFSPAYAAAQTGLVHPLDLTRSLSLWQIMRQTVNFIGPPLAGVLVGLVGYAGALALDAGTFLVAAICIFFLRLRWAPRAPKERRPFWRDFAGGFTVVTANPTILRTVLLGSGVNLAGAAFTVLLPVIALREMRLAPAMYGLFQTVSPVGVMLGMVILTAVARRIVHRGRFMLHCLLLMGAANLVMGWATLPSYFLVLLFVGGVFFGLSNVMFADIWRRLVPQEQQGRFFGMQDSLNQALMPVGIGLAGLLSDVVSPYVIAAGAGGVVVSLALWGLAGRGLREIA